MHHENSRMRRGDALGVFDHGVDQGLMDLGEEI
jgi:hypothetical protein